MNSILLTVGALTLGGSAAVLLLAGMGRSTRKRYGAKWRCWAWLLLCLRLAVPLPLVFREEARAPIQVEVPNPPAVAQTPEPAASASAEALAPGTQPQAPGDGPVIRHPTVVEPSGRTPIDPVTVLLGIWLIGAAVLLAWNGWSHLRFLSYLHRWSSPVAASDAIQAFNRLGDQLGLDRRPRLLVCPGLKVPMLAGIVRPAILLPQGAMTGEELGFSLLHELTHYRRRDIWLKTLVMWVNMLYWFNPVMWYMIRLVERDTELACDEDALRRLPRSDYAAYGQTILNAVARLQNREKEGDQDE